MSRADAIYEVRAFPAQERQPELGGLKQRRGRNTQVGGRGKQGLLLKGCRTMIIESPLQLIFRDLFYRLPAFAGRHDVFLKLEGFNITGSIKVKTDRACRGLGTARDCQAKRNRIDRIVIRKSRASA